MVSPREIPKPEPLKYLRKKREAAGKTNRIKIRIGRQPIRQVKIKKLKVPVLTAPPNHPILTKAIERYEQKKATCCDILYVHHEALKGDRNRFTTDFIRTFSKCQCG
jgi:hypothetical protein